MKKLSQVIVEAKELSLQDDTMNFASAEALKTYLQKTEKFISVEAKNITNWLIANNSTYMKEFGSLQKFYAKGKPKDPKLQELYKWIGVLSKKKRLIEIPVFQTEEQFDAIVSGKEAPDEVLLDLNTEKGRNDVAKKFTPLVWKIARSFNGKSRLTLDELFSVGMEGLTRAMNCYGKSAAETRANGKFKNKDAEEIASELDAEKEEARKKYTFLSFAAYNIRIFILEAIKHESHLVRIPASVQKAEKAATGRNTKSNSVSGEEVKGGGDEGKTIFDKIDSKEDSDASLDRQDIEKLWKMIIKMLEKKFNEKQLDIWYSMNGLFGHEKMKGKEIMKKYGLKNASEISNSNWKILNYIQTTPEMKKAFAELYSLYKECLNDEDRRNEDPSTIRIVDTDTSYTE